MFLGSAGLVLRHHLLCLLGLSFGIAEVVPTNGSGHGGLTIGMLLLTAAGFQNDIFPPVYFSGPACVSRTPTQS